MAITISATQGYTQATRDTTWSTTTTQRIGRTVVSTTSRPYYALRFAVTSTLALSDLTLAITGGTNFYDAGTPTIYARVTTDSTWRPTTSSTGTECTLNPSYTAVGKGTINATVSTAVAANTTTYVWLFTTGASAAYFAYYPISTGSTASAEAAFTGTVQNYSVTLTSGSGYSYNKTSPQTVTAGSSFSFSVTISTGYMASDTFAVKAGSTTLTPSSSSGSTYNYSVSINANTTITVTGVMLGGIVRIGDGTNWVDYQVYICDGTNWYQYLPYIGDSSNWNLYS